MLTPGDRVREVDIAEQFGISRTPIREAIRRLESDGIVEHKARFGAVVRTLSHTEIVELYEMRLVLEATAASMAAKHVSPVEIQELYDLNDAMLEAGADSVTVSAHNEHLHRSIYLAARNRFLLESFRSLNNAIMLLGPTTIEGSERLSEVHVQHGALIDALAEGDALLASERAKAHIETSLLHRLKALRG